MENLKPIRQGDVWLIPLPAEETVSIIGLGKLKEKMYRVPNRPGEGIIIAEGEATGHHHCVRTRGARLYRRGGRRVFHAPRGGATITHEEHAALEIPAGDYEVKIAREYEPQAAPRRVFD